MRLLAELLGSSNPPLMPHGICYLWTPGLVWLHVISDAAITLAYYSIPISLAWFVRKRRDVDFRGIYLCFAVFILACGTTHLLEIWNVWHADYWLSGTMKAVTAAASLPTAYLLTRLLPTALTLPSPGVLTQVNMALAAEVESRKDAENRLRDWTLQLEERVLERTAQLEATNAELKRQMAERDDAKEALRESEDLFAKSFLLSPDCIAITRLSDRVVIRANEGLCALWGCTTEEAVGKPAPDYSNWVDEDDRLAFMKTLTETGECLDHDTSLRMGDGRLLDFNVSSRLITFRGEDCILSVMRDITERRRAEKAAAHLASIVESSEDAIVGKDLNGIVTSWNAGAEKIFGYAPSEIIGRSILPIIPSDRLHEEEGILRIVPCGESVRPFETQRLRKDGRLIHVSVAVSPIRDAKGNIVGASKVARDITATKAAEMDLLETKSRYEAAVLASGQILYDWNSHTHETRFGGNLEKIIGYQVAEMDGPLDRWQAIIHPDDRAMFDAELARVIATGKSFELDYRLVRKDGATIHVRDTGHFFKDARGSVERMLGFVSDITERKNAELALHASREEFKDLFDNAPIGYHVVDAAGRISQINHTELKMLGYEADELLGQPVWKIADDEELSRNAVTEKLRGVPPPPAFERTLRRKDGMTFPVLIEDRLVYGEDGVVVGIRAIIQDVTERKRAEQAIHQLNAELERRVIERTAQLEAANKELESFSYSVSHDLRAPLRAIGGFAQIVREDYAAQLDAEGQRLLGVVCREARRMGVLIDDLLRFSRLGRQSLELSVVDMTSLVNQVFGDLAGQHARMPAIELAELPAAHGDRPMLRQVFSNLLGNAVKFSAQAEAPVIRVSGAREGNIVTYHVADNGVGFDEKYKAKLFGVFQRLHSEAEFEGTGVGLALVQRIVARHGGMVSATGAPGKGATFTFTLSAPPP